MKPHHKPVTTHERIEAFGAAIWACVWRLLWLVIAAPRTAKKRIVRRQVRRLERLVECQLLLRANQRVYRHLPRYRRQSTRFALAGFRRVRSSGRLLNRCARIRLRGGSLANRIIQLIIVLSAPERYITRFARRMRRGVCLTHILPAAPPAQNFATRARAALPALADSS